MPVLEAMASGVPVIASNTTSLPEIAGDAARLVDPRSLPAIHRAIEDTIADEGNRRKMVERGLERVQCFSWERGAAELAGVYSRLLQEDARRAGGKT